MKIAVIISGHLRSFDECWPSWLKVSDKNNFDCDYYVHTYTSFQRLDRGGSCSTGKLVEDRMKAINPVAFEIVDDNEHYKDHIVDDYNELIKANTKVYQGRHEDLKRQLCMFKKLQLAYNLVINKSKYDVFIRLRPDTYWGDSVIFPKDIDSKLITISRGSVQHPDVACDNFGLMNSLVSSVYFNTYDTISKRAKSNRMRRYNAEVHLGMNMIENGIKIIEVECSNFHIKRT